MDALLRPGWLDCCQKRSPNKADARLLLNKPRTGEKRVFRTYRVPYVFDEDGQQISMTAMTQNSKFTPKTTNTRENVFCSSEFSMGKLKTETEQEQDQDTNNPLQMAKVCWQDSPTLLIRLSIQLDYSDAAAFTLTLTRAGPMPAAETKSYSSSFQPS